MSNATKNHTRPLALFGALVNAQAELSAPETKAEFKARMIAQNASLVAKVEEVTGAIVPEKCSCCPVLGTCVLGTILGPPR